MRFAAVLLVVLLSACARPEKYGVIMPRGGDTYTVASKGRTEDQAATRATRAASMVCDDKGKGYAVTAVQTYYGGLLAERQHQTIDNVAEVGAAVAATVSDALPLPLPTLRGRGDYRVEMAFRCE